MNTEQKRQKRTWAWDCGGKVLLAERNVARDTKLSRLPRIAEEKMEILHTGERAPVIAWQWQGDGRVFLVPKEILGVAATIPLARDIIAAGHLYREHHYPQNRTIETSYRQLAELLGLEWAGGRLVRDLDDALTLARWVTIRNYPIIRKLYPDGRIREFSRDTFGFIERVSRIEIREGQRIPRNRQPLEICLSEIYALAIKRLPAAPVPLLALEAAHKAPQRLRTPAKNLVYYLASRVPLQHVYLSVSTLADILGYQNTRKYELQRAIENVVKVLQGTAIRDYTLKGGVYAFTLAGRPYQEKQDGT